MSSFIQYPTDLPDPLAAFTKAYGLGSAMLQQQQQAAAAQREAAQQEQLMAALGRLHEPGATAADYARVMTLVPAEQAKSLKEAYALISEEEKAGALKQAGEIYAALRSGATTVAKQLLDDKIEAAKNSGDKQTTQALTTLRQAADTPEGLQIAEDYFGLTLSMLPGGDKVIEAAPKVVDARYEEQAKIAGLKKQAADLGLTEAQTTKAILEGKKISIEMAQLLMETEALRKNGGLTPVQKFDKEKAIRDEYTKKATNFQEMTLSFEQMNSVAKEQTGAGDVALLTTFQKMLDPGSVVRETEYARGQDTGGLVQRLIALGKQVQSGQLLTDDQRKNLVQVAGKYLEAAEKYVETTRSGFGPVIASYGLDPANIFGPGATTATGEEPSAAPAAGETATSGSSDLANLKAWIREKNPATTAAVETMTEAEIAEAFPNSYKAYRARAQTAAPPQEVDY